jgi:hypothetical protein
MRTPMIYSADQITHKDTDGDFVVTITDHRDW